MQRRGPSSSDPRLAAPQAYGEIFSEMANIILVVQNKTKNSRTTQAVVNCVRHNKSFTVSTNTSLRLPLPKRGGRMIRRKRWMTREWL